MSMVLYPVTTRANTTMFGAQQMINVSETKARVFSTLFPVLSWPELIVWLVPDPTWVFCLRTFTIAIWQNIIMITGRMKRVKKKTTLPTTDNSLFGYTEATWHLSSEYLEVKAVVPTLYVRPKLHTKHIIPTVCLLSNDVLCHTGNDILMYLSKFSMTRFQVEQVATAQTKALDPINLQYRSAVKPENVDAPEDEICPIVARHREATRSITLWLINKIFTIFFNILDDLTKTKITNPFPAIPTVPIQT